MKESIFKITDSWLYDDGPEAAVVVSCRARFARNLAGLPFPPRAPEPALAMVVERIKQMVHQSEIFQKFYCLPIDVFQPKDRMTLRESQVISQEMERGGQYRLIYVCDSPITSVMVNEEDHLRLFAILPGLQIQKTLDRLLEIDDEIEGRLDIAYSEQFGYLTACPTNTGTGLRISVMLHLPGLVEVKQMDEILATLPSQGMAVRGLHGENSPNVGNFYQISNEVTLGVTEQQIADRLGEVIRRIVDRESTIREYLFTKRRTQIEDKISRAFSLLSSSRIMDTREAINLLSVLRFGIDSGYLQGMSHSRLNRLIVQIQPGHIQREEGRDMEPIRRDIARADILRASLGDVSISNN